jgi:hypothetical protein
MKGGIAIMSQQYREDANPNAHPTIETFLYQNQFEVMEVLEDDVVNNPCIPWQPVQGNDIATPVRLIASPTSTEACEGPSRSALMPAVVAVLATLVWLAALVFFAILLLWMR